MSGYYQPQGDYGQAQGGHQQPHQVNPIGVFKPFMAHSGSTIVLKEHVLSLTGDSFSIKTADGTPILQVEGKLMSISGRKKVSDMAGNHLFDIVKEHFHIHTTYAVEDPQGQKLMEVKNSFKSKSNCKITAGSNELRRFDSPQFLEARPQRRLKMRMAKTTSWK